MPRPRTRARNVCLTQPLGPSSRAWPDAIVSGSVPRAPGVMPAPGVVPTGVVSPGASGVAGCVRGTLAQSSPWAIRPFSSVPLAIAQLSAERSPTFVAMAQSYVQTSPGSNDVSDVSPVRTSSQAASVNSYVVNVVVPVFLTEILKCTVVPATAVGSTASLTTAIPIRSTGVSTLSESHFSSSGTDVSGVVDS